MLFIIQRVPDFGDGGIFEMRQDIGDQLGGQRVEVCRSHGGKSVTTDTEAAKEVCQQER